jgi:hypothetical protein
MRQRVGQHEPDSLGAASVIRIVQEEKHARPPVVVGRDRVIEAEHFRAGTDERGSVAQVREMVIQERPHSFPVETLAESQARERWWICCIHPTSICQPRHFFEFDAQMNQPLAYSRLHVLA